MKIFNKLKYFQAKCTFCQSIGMVYGAFVNDTKQEVAVCDDCSRKLITGIATALEELKKQFDAEQKEDAVRESMADSNASSVSQASEEVVAPPIQVEENKA